MHLIFGVKKLRTATGGRCVPLSLPLLLILLLPCAVASSDELADAEALFFAGKYDACIAAAETAIEKITWIENWRHLKIEAELATGRYVQALSSLEEALLRHQSSIRIRLLGRRVYRLNQRDDMADAMLDQIEALVQRSPWRYNDGASRVTLGRYFLIRGADARQVLDVVFDRTKKDQPAFVDAYTASGDLALAKNDFAVAAEEFGKAVELQPGDPDLHYKLAESYAPSDLEKARVSLAKALELNPRHTPSLLFQAERMIDAEAYQSAESVLENVLETNPSDARAWSLLAVLAHLRTDADGEACRRANALCTWPNNPEVDHLIGKKLSQKYRFAEGASYQRRALEIDPGYLPAKMQLSQDLLRLGEEATGWRLAQEVFENDGYNVAAYNLVTLQESLAKFRTLERDGFVLRMAANEAAIYGEEVLRLLTRAKSVLCEKYDFEITEPVVVEIFPQQKDFAIRTFGMPGGAGFLGVCFGNVITANSPASQTENPSNWRAVLWHEFCHVVTLQKTNNKMPRWLSEGISVYEELQENETWGQRMTPRYREFILGDELTPVSRLSGAFLEPPSPLHLQFAYFEAAMVVEYLIEKYGLEVLKRILVDLGVGMPINESLQRYVGSLAALDHEFAQYARKRANSLAPTLNWERPPAGIEADANAMKKWGEANPKNFWALQWLAQQAIEQQDWSAAKQRLETLIEGFPEFVAAGNAYQSLAAIHRRLEEEAAERATLDQLAERSADAIPTYLRLLELHAADENWAAVAENADRVLAVNPLIREPYRQLARAAEKLDRPEHAIRACQALLQLDPADPAGTHFQLAQLLYAQQQTDAAKRHVLMALEEAPRFLDAHRLLLEIVQRDATEPKQVDPGDESETSGSNEVRPGT